MVTDVSLAISFIHDDKDITELPISIDYRCKLVITFSYSNNKKIIKVLLDVNEKCGIKKTNEMDRYYNLNRKKQWLINILGNRAMEHFYEKDIESEVKGIKLYINEILDWLRDEKNLEKIKEYKEYKSNKEIILEMLESKLYGPEYKIISSHEATLIKNIKVETEIERLKSDDNNELLNWLKNEKHIISWMKLNNTSLDAVCSNIYDIYLYNLQLKKQNLSLNDDIYDTKFSDIYLYVYRVGGNSSQVDLFLEKNL